MPGGYSSTGGIPNLGSYTTTRLDKWPEYRQTYADVVASGHQPTAGDVAGIVSYVNQGRANAAAQNAGGPARYPTPTAGGSSGGSRGRRVSYRRSYGGGGGRRGGGGGGGASKAAQSEIDAMAGLLGSGAYKLDPNDPRWKVDIAPYDQMRTQIGSATAQDQAAATGAYNNLDQYLQGHQANPYANVQLQRAQTAPNMNPYLASQGVGGTQYQQTNPEDTGYGAFQNVLALLGANQQAGNQSRLAESQMARTYSGQQIGATDNAYLANVANQQAQAQQALNTARLQAQQQLEQEKRAAALQMMQLLAQPGTKAPDLAALGFA
jgi:hypothetical protein